MSKQIPILFSTPMVEAILAGRKTQTRRIMKPQIECNHYDYSEATWQNEPTKWSVDQLKETGHTYCIYCGNGMQYGKANHGIRCPYGMPGDILWVRETWQTSYDHKTESWAPIYKADSGVWIDDEGSVKFKPSIHMKKEHARIWLEVVDVRVERLQDISEEDAKAEGVEPNCEGKDGCPSSDCKDGCSAAGEYFHYMRDHDDFPAFSAKESFESLWEKINGPESWDANPWTWVISFRVLSTTGNPSELCK